MFHRARRGGPARTGVRALLLALALLSAAAVSEASAQPRKPSAPARFFTINQVLAKQEAGRPAAAGKLANIEIHSASDASPAAREQAGPEPFGMFAFRAPEGPLWSKWRRLEAERAREVTALAACREDPARCSKAAARYAAILAEIETQDGRAKIETANRLVNRAIRYAGDHEQHRQPDRWTAPLASLAAGRGDCEDYAIVKLAALRDAGLRAHDLRLVLLRDTAAGLDHAVLAVRAGGRWLVLDNRRDAIADAAELPHYTPLFALDAEGVKLYAAPYARWGEGAGEFAAWRLRGSDFADWSLRGAEFAPAATQTVNQAAAVVRLDRAFK
jgi:predicted transglutaminase-like cysteine proteinase